MMNRIAQRGPLILTLVIGMLIASFFALALYVRISNSHEVVFGGSIVRFTGVDAYWHMRIVDNLAHNFPHLNRLDPYMLHPGGFGTSYGFPFFDYLLAGVIWVIGLGSPTQHTVDMVGPYFPPVMGALTLVPVYFIGRTLFSRWAGVVAAGLVAILPGEFLGRSILGFTDHHVAETLFTTTAVMFLVLALKNSKKERMIRSHLRHPNSSGLTKPAVYGLLGGVCLGIYLISWMGALLFVFIIAAFFLAQFCIDHIRKVPTDYLCLVGVATFLPALVIFSLVSRERNTCSVLAIAVVMSAAMFAVSRLMSNRGLSPWYYPMAVGGLGSAAFGVLYAAVPSLVRPMLDHLEIFKWDKGTTVAEMVPTLYQRLSGGEMEFTFRPLWETYHASILFCFVGLCILVYLVVKRGEPEKALLVVWTLVILLAALAQRRFNYYLVVNIALVTGYLSWEALRFAGLREPGGKPAAGVDSSRKLQRSGTKSKKFQEDSFRLRPSHAYVALTAIAVFSVLYFPTIGQSRIEPRYFPPEAWCESLTWLKDNTPEPFDDADFYYERYETPFDYSAYPEAYGVMAWWDYGYWIVRIGHRPPSQNPGGAIPAAAEFFLAQDESEGQRILDERGARYVILDFDFVTGKFYGAVRVTGKSQQDYYDRFVVETTDSQGETQLRSATFYLPAYYQSMSVRLYNFEGKAVTPGPGDCRVFSWTWWEYEGVQYKRGKSPQTFDTYEAALDWMAKQPSGNYNIVGNNPFVSPVPLEELNGFALRHDSEITEPWSNSGDTIPQVRIFEYVK